MAVSNTVVFDGPVVLDPDEPNPVTATLSSEGNTVKLDPGSTNQVTIGHPVMVVGGVEALGPPIWVEHDSDTNAVASATKSAESGFQHLFLGFLAGYSDAAVSGTVTVKFGETSKFVWPIVGSSQALLPGCLWAENNEAISVELSAGGEGKVGYVTFFGKTEFVPPSEPEP